MGPRPRTRSYLWVGAASVLARLPLGMLPLQLLIVARAATGSAQTAGLTVGAFALAAGLGAPVRGRLTDRHGALAVLAVAGTAHTLAIAACAPASHLGAGWLAAGAAAVGATVPPAGPVVRAVWPTVLGRDGLTRALALDALALQLIHYVAGPAAAAVLAARWAGGSLVVTAAVAAVGTLSLTAAPAVRALRSDAGSSVAPSRRREPLLRAPGLPGLLGATALAAAAVTALEVAVSGVVLERGAVALTGLLLGLLGVGSVAGALVQATRRAAAPTGVQYRRWLVVLTVTTALVAAAPPAADLAALPVLAVLGGSLVLAGVAIAPAGACQFTLAAELAPPARRVEAFTWLYSASLAGSALGSALAGVVADHVGSRLALVVPGVLTLITAGWAHAAGSRATRDRLG